MHVVKMKHHVAFMMSLWLISLNCLNPPDILSIYLRMYGKMSICSKLSEYAYTHACIIYCLCSSYNIHNKTAIPIPVSTHEIWFPMNTHKIWFPMCTHKI